MEPSPKIVTSLAGHSAPVNKLLLLGDPRRLEESRSDVGVLVGKEASLTVAMPQMLEVLPPGCSKGQGVSKLLSHLGVRPGATIALGDAENDTGMLEMVGVGIAMVRNRDMIKAP
uniref:Sucrose phosphatase-like domain-containing protein n=1 Tax=Octactis speculum TaxID=3111310 RepID=A0A7S2GDM6_9STRA|mmetsp:Transcript_43481/g.59392  ORF Transcript_43481/g.59392 Transcript_43481/m.59392 type:complete len:115 (+) Transcript_43481:207-551(+)